MRGFKNVPIDAKFEYKLSDGEMIEIFGIEPLSKVDSHAITNILGNG